MARGGARHDSRRPGLERAGRGDAGLRRQLRVSARGVRPGALRPAGRVPLHLVVHPQRPARDRLRLHRVLAIRALHLAGSDVRRTSSPWRPASALLNVILLYRRIEAIGTLTVSLWIGTLLTTAAVIVSGALNFDAARAFDFPPGAFDFSIGFLLGLGAASRVGIYDYLGYYDVCYIGDEVKDPGRVIPRSIMISIVAVAVIYIAINLSIIGVVPGASSCPPTRIRNPNSSSRCSWSGSTDRRSRRCSRS